MKRSVYVLFALFAFAATSFAQSANNNYIPELVFQNPTLVSGQAGKNGATYKFSNVAAGIDATVKIKSRSSNSVVLTNIDVSNTGWKKAFQPQFGPTGNVSGGQDWWMDFEMTFYEAGSSKKKKIKGFSVTAIDVDGDGLSIREYVQMNNITSYKLSSYNHLVQHAAATIASDGDSDEDYYNSIGTNQKLLGPVTNFANIDTMGTSVMATFNYEEKDKITFRYGAKSSFYTSNAGERLNSLWFKAFNLAPHSTLPVTIHSFNVSYDKKNASLTWSAQADDKFSHFVVEKSTDGTTYQPAGQVQASTTVTNYSLTDANISSATGIVYYRIQCVEKTGEMVYSPVKLVRLAKESTASLSVFPNPVQGTANLTLPYSWQNKPVTVTVYSGTGVQVQNISLAAASQTERLDMSRLPKGIYVVKAQCSDEWAEQRILRN